MHVFQESIEEDPEHETPLDQQVSTEISVLLEEERRLRETAESAKEHLLQVSGRDWFVFLCNIIFFIIFPE